MRTENASDLWLIERAREPQLPELLFPFAAKHVQVFGSSPCGMPDRFSRRNQTVCQSYHRLKLSNLGPPGDRDDSDRL
jgi:hypothetical protein